MNNIKNKIQAVQDHYLAILSQPGSKETRARIDDIRQQVKATIKTAKAENDSLTQLYGCLVDMTLDNFMGSRAELADKIRSLLVADTPVLLAEEKNVPVPDKALMLDADTYGFYYALNDYYSRQWDGDDYALSRNGDIGNALITNMIKAFYLDDKDEPVYDHVTGAPYKRSRSKNSNKESLLKSFVNHQTALFTDVRIAFVGYYGYTNNDIIRTLYSAQSKQPDNLNFSPDMGLPALTIEAAQACRDGGQEMDYVITSNVINGFAKHGVNEDNRDKICAAVSLLLKESGLAINVIEKPSRKDFLYAYLDENKHDLCGQKAVYSFYRKKTPLDFESDAYFRKNEAFVDRFLELMDTFPVILPEEMTPEEATELEEIKDDKRNQLRLMKDGTMDANSEEYATSLLVLVQKEKSHVTEGDVIKQRDIDIRYNPGPFYERRP